MSHLATRTLIAEDITETPPHLGIKLHRLTMVAIPLIVKAVLVITTIVKDPPDTTIRDETHTDRAGDPYLHQEHI
jgi:hypothetical protein